MAEFCSARSNTISPLQWTTFAPPFTLEQSNNKPRQAFYPSAMEGEMIIEKGCQKFCMLSHSYSLSWINLAH